MPRKCEKCGRPATYKFTRFANGKPQDHYLCEDHAVETSRWVQKPPTPEAIKAWLKGIVESAGEAAGAGQKIPDVKCRACGLPFEAYKRTLLLGCAECYRSFEELIIPELRKFHGEIKHFGRMPQAPPTPAPSTPSVTPGMLDLDAPTPPPPETPIAKAPEPAKPPLDIDELRRRLKKAVEVEDFEEAARLRDHMRQQERNKTP